MTPAPLYAAWLLLRSYRNNSKTVEFNLAVVVVLTLLWIMGRSIAGKGILELALS
jgi:hypothetical protein